MANISAIKLPNGTTYNLKDNGALQLTGGSVTGPVSFGDSVSIDEATVGDLVVNGSASFTNNLQANTINGVAVGSSPKFTDTTYSSLAAASGGTAVSLVTTGEKYTWNSKTSNTGTITSVKTTAGAHTTVNLTSGAVSFNVPTTAAHVGAVPTTRKVNNKALSSDISLTASDVGAVSDVQLNGTSIKSGTVADLVTSELVDIFYPVGSYYETSDITFDPNTSWGGTWQLETEGQVHISAGTTYTVDGALTDTTDGGSEYIQEHAHIFTNPTYTTAGAGSHNHMPAVANRVFVTSTSGVEFTRHSRKQGTGTEVTYLVKSTQTMGYSTYTDTEANHSHTVNLNSNGVVGVVSGETTGNAGNMPPYIVVNRWHRTA